MNYVFLPTMVMRNPIFSYRDYPLLKSDELLKHGFFKAALYIASIDLYRELEKRDFDYSSFSSGQKNSLRKYYNRACYRPTPFGAFSSVTIANWSRQSDIVSFEEENIRPHLKLDYQANLELCEQLILEEAAGLLKYKSNTSIYRVSRSLRYLKYGTDIQQSKRKFSINSLTENDIINEVLVYCHEGRTYKEIAAALIHLTGFDEQTVDHFVTQLIDEQIVLPVWGNSITGNGSLEDLLAHLTDQHISSPRTEKIAGMLHAFDHMNADDFDSVLQYRQQLSELVEPAEGKHIFYAVTERGDTTGGVAMERQQQILDALYCMNKLVPQYENEELERFKIAFTAKFEGREIPLLMALDPEVGIGYENQEDVVYQEEALLKDVQFEDPKDQPKFLKWTMAHSLLLNKVYQQSGDHSAYQIELTAQDLDSLPPPRGEQQLPPSISVVFRLYNGLLYLESAGGASATSLIGRFSAFNDRFLDLATEIAEKEQALNPDVLFAEIAHICDMHAANINRRKHVRKYEVPVMVMSTLEGERQLELSDLYVSLRNGQIVLRSKKHDAVVIPRLSTAFNHHNSELSVFRFLCDLQYQGMRASFKLEMEHFFPGLQFYPRVIYKSSILSLATWHLKAGDFAAMKTGNAGKQFNLFHQLARQIKLPRYFALTQHDNHLVFDRDQEDDVLLFLDAIKHYDKITLTEFLMNDEGRADVTNSQGKPLIGQYTAALYLNETVYNFAKAARFEEATAGHRNFAPGTEWTYFKIYCHPALANELLCHSLMPLLEWVYERKIIDKWFYIRYNDPDHHIRLRLHTLNGQSDMLMALFSQQLRTLLDEQKIEKYHIDIYVRELERYAPATINDVESFFFGSSLLTLSYMNRSAQDESLHPYNLDFIMLSMDEMLNAFRQPLTARVALFQKLYLSFYEEFKGDKNLKKSLEKKYADLRQEIKQRYESLADLKAALGGYCDLLHNYCLTIAEKVQDEPAGVVEKIQADLIHMHLNRLFVQNPRRQELIIYYLLYKHYNALAYKNQIAS